MDTIYDLQEQQILFDLLSTGVFCYILQQLN